MGYTRRQDTQVSVLEITDRSEEGNASSLDEFLAKLLHAIPDSARVDQDDGSLGAFKQIHDVFDDKVNHLYDECEQPSHYASTGDLTNLVINDRNTQFLVDGRNRELFLQGRSRNLSKDEVGRKRDVCWAASNDGFLQDSINVFTS